MRTRIRYLVAVLVICGLVAAGCGGDDDDAADDTAAQDSGSAETGGTSTLDFTLDDLIEGTHEAPPTDGPAAQPDKTVWIISCGEAVPSCAGPTAGAVEAGDAIGWDVTLFDGQLNPTLYGDGIRAAVAAGADAVVLAAVDCPVVQQPLQEAKAAGTAVIALYSIDCDEPIFDAEVQFAGYDGLDTPYSEVVADWGAAKARYLIETLDGDVKVINFHEDDLLAVTDIYEGFERELATCDTCEIVATVEFTFPDLLSATGLRDQTVAALEAHPEANAVHSLYDGMSLLGVAQAVVDSGRNDEIVMAGGEGFAPNLDLIRGNGGQDAAIAFPTGWTGWAAIDTVNRVLAGEPIANSGNGWTLIDAERNLPAEGGFEPDVDYRAAYLAVWGG